MKRFKWSLFLVLMMALIIGGQAWAANYYVKNGGCTTYNASTCNGLSDAQAFGTVAVAFSEMSDGDDIYLKCGDTFSVSSTQWFPVSGTSSSNYAVMGAYYVDGNNAVVLNPGEYSASHPRPIVTGNNGLSSDVWLLIISGKNYVSIENINFVDSQGSGVKLAATNNSIVQYCRVYHFGQNGIALNPDSGYGSSNNLITHNEVDLIGWGGGNPCGISVISFTYDTNGAEHDNIISYNTVSRTQTEGIDLAGNEYNSIIEYNTVFDFWNEGIYPGDAPWKYGPAMNSIVRYNLVYAHSTDYPNNSGIHLYDEPYYYGDSGTNIRALNAYIYGNVVIGAEMGISIDVDPLRTYSSIENTYIFNNTLIANRYQLVIHNNEGKYTNTLFRNNLVWMPSNTTLSPQKNMGTIDGSDYETTGGVDWSYNYWYPNCYNCNEAHGTGDIGGCIGDSTPTEPVLLSGSISNWRPTADNPVTFTMDQFKMGTSYGGKNVGVTLGAPYNSDYWGTTRPDGAYDIGAYEEPSGLPTVSGGISSLIGGSIIGGSLIGPGQ